MDNDRIILELLNRVSILEEKVEALEKTNIPKEQIGEQSEQTFSKAEIVEQSMQYPSPAYKGKDTSQYLFDGVKYGKNRLVLAVVKKYAENHPNITAEELIRTFDRSLQGSLGVVKTVNEIKMSSADSERRFFLKPNELIKTSTAQCAVCNQWAVFNIGNFIARARQLGMTITEI